MEFTMNNKYLASLLCITVLTFAPACTKRNEKSSSRDDINTMIELETEVYEMEETTEDQNSVVKF
jgi:hypothetical protein